MMKFLTKKEKLSNWKSRDLFKQLGTLNKVRKYKSMTGSKSI